MLTGTVLSGRVKVNDVRDGVEGRLQARVCVVMKHCVTCPHRCPALLCDRRPPPGLQFSQMIELPTLKETRKVKSMQMFHKPVQSAAQGDRLGLCIAGLNAAALERGIACSPGAVPTIHACLALVRKIKYFRGDCESNSKFHVTVGHTTVMGTVVFFGAHELANHSAAQGSAAESADSEPATVAAGGGGGGDEKGHVSRVAKAMATSLSLHQSASMASAPDIRFDAAQWYRWQDKLLAPGAPTTSPTVGGGAATKDGSKAKSGGKAGGKASGKPAGGKPAKARTDREAGTGDGDMRRAPEWQWALVALETPVVCPEGSVLIGSRLDADMHTKSCRIAFQGRMVCELDTQYPTAYHTPAPCCTSILPWLPRQPTSSR